MILPRLPCAVGRLVLLLAVVGSIAGEAGPTAAGRCRPVRISARPGAVDSLHGVQSETRRELQRLRASGCQDANSVAAVVTLEPGMFRLSRPLRFTAEDSGSRWLAAQPGTATVSGGAPVTGWKDHADGLLQAPFPSAVAMKGPPRHLYIGTTRANRTSHQPNATVVGLGLLDGAIVTAEGIATNSSAPLAWNDPATVEFRHDASYQQSRCGVAAVRPRPSGGATVQMMQPCWGLGRALGSMDFPSAVLNLGQSAGSPLAPGQWHWNKTVFLYRPNSESERSQLLDGSLGATTAVSGTLVEVDGATAYSLEGLRFEHTAWTAPVSADGYLERYGGVRYLLCNSTAGRDTGACYSDDMACQAGCCGAASMGGCSLRMAEAAVHIRASESVLVTGCTFTQLGAWGLALTQGTRRATVSHNRFFDSSGGAIYLGNVNETRVNTTLRHPAALVVENNIIENIGVEYQGSSGIHLFSAVDSTVRHNRLFHTPYTAITFVWPVPQAESFNRNLSLVGNDVEDPSYWGTDGGAVHTLAQCTDCVLSRNYFHNQHHGTKCTYIDNTSSGYNVTMHVVDAAPKSLWLYYQQSCRPSCPYEGVNPYPGCNETAHDKCCCNAGVNNHASRCWSRGADPDPFPIPNLTDYMVVPVGSPFPPAAEAIISASGPRPSAAAFAFPGSRPGLLPVPLPGSPSGSPSGSPLGSPRVAGRDAALFICCSTTPAQWARFLPVIEAHRENVTSAIIALYEVDGQGVLVDQGQYVAQGVAAAAELRAMGLRTTALAAVSPGGIRLAMYNATVAAGLVKQLVSTAAETGLQGFNLDAEFPNDQNHTDGDRFVAVLDAMATALHAINCTLSVDVHGDGDTPFDFHVWGPAYRASLIDKVITMATYTDAKTLFDKYFATATSHLGHEKYQPGLEMNAVLSNPKDIFYILSKNVTSIAVWNNPPAEQVYWDAMGLFLTAML